MPYGGLETWPKPLGPLETVPVLPVSVNESPKAYILLKGCELTLVEAAEAEEQRMKMKMVVKVMVMVMNEMKAIAAGRSY